MSANIYWEPADRPAEDVPTSAPSRFLETLRRLTQNTGHEFTLSDEHRPGLEALAEAVWQVDENKNPYRILVKAIEKHGSIRVWAQY